MAYQNIKIEISDGVAVLTLNRPEVRNALDFVTWDEIRAGMRALRDDNSVHVIIITGAGGKAFASGADIRALHARTVGEQMCSETNDILYEISSHKKPVIAAIDGYALGGGCELAMACDIRVASEKAKFGQPEVNLGIIPGFGGTQRLPRLIGKGMAKYLIMTGEHISAQEALRIGLVQKVVAPEELTAEAERIAKLIVSKAPVAVRMAKCAVNVAENTDMASGVAYEAEAYTTCFQASDRVEGMTAFLEKREASFQGK